MFENNGANFSDDRKNRYCLWRIWDEYLPKIAFIGLNPSTANESTNDATIRRVMSFAKAWGYGGVYMLNCFPFITTDPKEIEINYDSIQINENYVTGIGNVCVEIIFAWGNFEIVKREARDERMKTLFPNAKCLGKNKNGSPKHPLYIANNIQRIIF